MIKKLICAAALLMVAGLQHTRAQYVYGTTGLLHAPSADMQRDKTFLCGFSYLQVAATPKHWNYDTWNYYINITLFPWLEVGYTCTLHKIGLPQLVIHINSAIRTASFPPGCVYGRRDGGRSGHRR